MKTFSQFINENNNNESENGILMFRAATKGGKYAMEVYKKKNQHGEYYDVIDTTNGRTRGVASRNTLEDVRFYLANSIWGSKAIDGINYIVSLDDIGIDEELKDIEEIETVTHSPEFKQWIANMGEEEIKNLEIEAKDFYKTNPNKASMLRRRFFVDKFKKTENAS
jgi:hypothetical protein